MYENNTNINYADICCGLSWGDEAKGKIIAELSKSNTYNYVLDGQVEIMQDILFILIKKIYNTFNSKRYIL